MHFEEELAGSHSSERRYNERHEPTCGSPAFVHPLVHPSCSPDADSAPGTAPCAGRGTSQTWSELTELTIQGPTHMKTHISLISTSGVEDPEDPRGKRAGEGGKRGAASGKWRPSPEPGRAEHRGPEERRQPRAEGFDSRPRQEAGPDTWSGKGAPTRRLTFGRLPHRQRCLSALPPEERQGREPGSRGAHYRSCHEAAQKTAGASEAGCKTFGSHLTPGTYLWP